MRRSSGHRWVLWFTGAFASVGGCTSLTAVDWSKVDDASPGNGGSAGSGNAGTSSQGVSGAEDGGASSDGDGGAGGEGGEPNGLGGSGGRGGMGGTTAGTGGTTAGMGGTTAGMGGTTAGMGGTTAGTGGTTAGTGGTGGTEPGPVCGDGSTVGNECEPPSSSLCSNACVTVATQVCVDCEQNGSCYEFTNSCIDNTTNAADQAKCFKVQECITSSNCGDGANTLTSCFCGALGTSDCIAAPATGPSAPAGACASVIREAMGGAAVTNNQVLTRFINIAFPGGAAIARYNCTKLDPGCATSCGF